MTSDSEFPHRFVETMPKTFDERVLYVSMEHAVAVHLCACGCGRKVVTPLAPIHWKLMFDGRSVSLEPSIGNHAFPCKSHYWIEEGKVRWSYEMSPHEVESMRAQDRRVREKFYDKNGGSTRMSSPEAPPTYSPSASLPLQVTTPRAWWRRLFG